MSEEQALTADENADESVITDAPEAVETAPTDEVKSDEESESSEKQEAESKEKPKVDLKQRKIAKQARENREMKRENTRLTKMLEMQIETASKVSKEGEAPKIEKFDSMDEYLDARDKYRDSKRETKQPRPEPTSNAHEDMFMHGAERYEDFEEVVNSSNNITPDMARAVLEVEDFDLQTDMAYFLGNNPKEAARISRLSPVRQMAEITRIEIKLSAKPAKKEASKAPAPVKPVGGSKTTSDEIRDVENFESFLKKRNKQLGR